MSFDDVSKIYVSLGARSGAEVEESCDQKKELEGSFFSANAEVSEVDYVGGVLRQQSLFYIDTTGKNLEKFHELFDTAMKENKLSIFKNLDLKNALSLLSAADSVTLTIPVHREDSLLNVDDAGSKRNVLNPSDIKAIFGDRGLISAEQEDQNQVVGENSAYIWYDITLSSKPSALQLLALYDFCNRLETVARSTEESDIVKYHGVDMGTLFALAKSQLKQAQIQAAENLKPKTYFLTKGPEAAQTNLSLSAERFDAYAETTGIKSILGNNEYMRLLSWGSDVKEVHHERLAQYAGMDGYDISTVWESFMDIDAQERVVFQDALTHFRENIVACEFEISTGDNPLQVEVYFDPIARYFDVQVKTDNQSARLESEANGMIPHEYSELKPSGDFTLSREQVFQILFTFRNYLISLNEKVPGALQKFDDQIEVGR